MAFPAKQYGGSLQPTTEFGVSIHPEKVFWDRMPTK
jgi:hypothetical protein